VHALSSIDVSSPQLAETSSYNLLPSCPGVPVILLVEMNAPSNYKESNQGVLKVASLCKATGLVRQLISRFLAAMLHESGVFVVESCLFGEGNSVLHGVVSRLLHGKNGRQPFSSVGIEIEARGRNRYIQVAANFTGVDEATWEKWILKLCGESCSVDALDEAFSTCSLLCRCKGSGKRVTYRSTVH
jgi:hypothetical protein